MLMYGFFSRLYVEDGMDGDEIRVGVVARESLPIQYYSFMQ